MTFLHTATDLAAGLMWLWRSLVIFLFACAAVWTVIRVNRWAREGVAGHVDAALDPEPIFPATAAYIAQHAAADLDREWADINRGGAA